MTIIYMSTRRPNWVMPGLRLGSSENLPGRLAHDDNNYNEDDDDDNDYDDEDDLDEDDDKDEDDDYGPRTASGRIGRAAIVSPHRCSTHREKASKSSRTC